jgi:hypothetical protein
MPALHASSSEPTAKLRMLLSSGNPKILLRKAGAGARVGSGAPTQSMSVISRTVALGSVQGADLNLSDFSPRVPSLGAPYSNRPADRSVAGLTRVSGRDSLMPPSSFRSV